MRFSAIKDLPIPYDKPTEIEVRLWNGYCQVRIDGEIFSIRHIPQAFDRFAPFDDIETEDLWHRVKVIKERFTGTKRQGRRKHIVFAKLRLTESAETRHHPYAT